MTDDSTTSLAERIAALGPWFHNLRLNGAETAPEHFLGDYPLVKWESFRDAVPEDLSGLTVLDIGCNAGFYSFEMKRRGAARVVGIDSDERYLRQARFAAEVCGADVEFRHLPVWEIASLQEKFDLVIFMGVFYHLRHPLLALDLIHEHVARDLFLFQSMQRGSRKTPAVGQDHAFTEEDVFLAEGFPAAYFVEHEYCGDATNWWIPNRSGVEAMLRSSGFAIENHPEREVYLCRWQERAAFENEPRILYPVRG